MNKVSDCPKCYCMTKTINGKCGKCGAVKESTGDINKEIEDEFIDIVPVEEEVNRQGTNRAYTEGYNNCKDEVSGRVEIAKQKLNTLYLQKHLSEIKERLGELRNPYPEDVFIEPTKEQYKKFNKYLKDMNLYPDAYNGSTGRRVWNALFEDILSVLKDMGVE